MTRAFKTLWFERPQVPGATAGVGPSGWQAVLNLLLGPSGGVCLATGVSCSGLYVVQQEEGEEEGKRSVEPLAPWTPLQHTASVGCFQGGLSQRPPARGWVIFIPRWRLHIPLLRLWRRFIRQ